MEPIRRFLVLVAGLALAVGCSGAGESGAPSPSRPAERVIVDARSPEGAEAALPHAASPDRAAPPDKATLPDQAAPTDALDLSYKLALAQLDGAYDPLAGAWGGSPQRPHAAPIVHSLMRVQWHGEVARLEQVRESLASYGKLIDPATGAVRVPLPGTLSPDVGTDAAAQAEALAAFGLAYRVTGDPAYLDNALAVGRYVRDTLTSPQGGFYASVGPDVDGPHGAMDRGIHPDTSGMLVTGLAQLYRASGDDQWRALSERALQRLERDYRRGDRVHHDGTEAGAALRLADHVQLAAATNALAEATMDTALWERADALMDTAVARFEDRLHGGFFGQVSGDGSLGALAGRRKPYESNALLVRLLITRGRRKHDDSDLERAERALRSLAAPGDLRAEREGVASYLVALEVLRGPLAIVRVVGPAKDARTRELYDRALSLTALGAVPLQEEPSASEYPYDGTPTIYLCAATACSAPITEPDSLHGAFQQFTPSAG